MTPYHSFYFEGDDIMIDINLIRNNNDLVKENIKKKFQDEKLEVVDLIYDMDKKFRDCKKK